MNRDERNQKLKDIEDKRLQEKLKIEHFHMAKEWASIKALGPGFVQRIYSRAYIAEQNARGGFYFFSKNTMRCFGDTLSNYAVVVMADKILLRRVREPSKSPDAGKISDAWFRFDPTTGKITPQEP